VIADRGITAAAVYLISELRRNNSATSAGAAVLCSGETLAISCRCEHVLATAAAEAIAATEMLSELHTELWQ
jgi:hypothetical protein